MTRQELGALLNLEENLIPQGRRNRPGTINVPNFITIHNTDNSNAGADARSHGRFLIHTGHYMLNGREHWVSWHYSVDDKRIVKHLPLNEKAFHAVNGNGQSIGIEICMNQGIDQAKAFLNAARLSAILLFDLESLNREIQKVVPHKFWTGKNCPRLLLDSGNVLGNKWNNFLDQIENELSSITENDSMIMADMNENFDSDINIHDLSSQDLLHLDVEEDETVFDNISTVNVPVKMEIYSEMASEAQKKGINVSILINDLLDKRV